jgi:hypothetical protein
MSAQPKMVVGLVNYWMICTILLQANVLPLRLQNRFSYGIQWVCRLRILCTGRVFFYDGENLIQSVVEVFEPYSCLLLIIFFLTVIFCDRFVRIVVNFTQQCLPSRAHDTPWSFDYLFIPTVYNRVRNLSPRRVNFSYM